MKDFRKLKVWERSHGLTLEVYGLTRGLPKEELFGLTSQMRRAASSIPANIAEGCGKSSDPDLRRFLGIAMGSASELEYHVLPARDLGYLSPAGWREVMRGITEVKKMLASLIKKLTAES